MRLFLGLGLATRAGVVAIAQPTAPPAAPPAAPSVPPRAEAPVEQPPEKSAGSAVGAGAIPDDDDRTELVVHLKDGRRFTGPVVRENADEVVIAIAGIPQSFPTAEVDRLETLKPVMERYRELHEAVGNDPDQIVNLAEWLRQRGKYELALTEILRSLSLDKTHGPSLKMKQLLEEQIILKSKRVNRAPENPEPVAPVKPNQIRAIDFPLLTPSDVQLIKVFETNLEEKPRVLIDRKVVAKMLEKYADHPLVPITREGREALLRQPALETLDLMFRIQARDFYPQVEVLDQPKAFVTLRDQVSRTWLLNSCATTLCHGGADAGRLALYNHSPNSERTVYTNFYILSQFRLKSGVPLINWDEPEKSPLVQMGLPRAKSRSPHPEVPHRISGHDIYKPAFQTTDDPQFKQTVEWLKSLYHPRPEYPIVYTPFRPFEAPALPIQPMPPKPPGTGDKLAPPARVVPAPSPKAPTTDSPSALPPESKPEPKPR